VVLERWEGDSGAWIYEPGSHVEFCFADGGGVTVGFMGEYGAAHQQRSLDVLASETADHHVWALLLVAGSVEHLSVVARGAKDHIWSAGGRVRLLWMSAQDVPTGLERTTAVAELVAFGRSGTVQSALPLVVCPFDGEAYFNSCLPPNWARPPHL
jgi:hypothetical protein